MVKPSSWIEISKSNLRDNIRVLKRIIGPGVEFCSVVKANAYGHGLAEFVPLAEQCGVRSFGVFSAEEAASLVACRTTDSDVMIMGALDKADIGWAVENGLCFWVFDLGRLEAAEKAAARCGRPARVHLELETGMYRLGLTPRAFAAALRHIARRPELLVLEGICSHLAGAESSANNHRISSQIQTFQEITDPIDARELGGFKRHLCGSAAGLLFPAARGDSVRFGIAQYGFWPSLETKMTFLKGKKSQGKDRLKRVMSWHSRLMDVKYAPAGKFVGYGNTFLTTRKTRIAAVPAGYHHGMERNQSNLGHLLVRGFRCPIVGIINMNMMSVDITHVPDARVGDEVVIIGHQGADEITVGEFGNRTNDLNYETLARLGANLTRIVVD
jgi:alanine racemase